VHTQNWIFLHLTLPNNNISHNLYSLLLRYSSKILVTTIEYPPGPPYRMRPFKLARRVRLKRDTKHNDEKNINHKIGRQSISNDVVDDVSSDRTIQIEDVTANRNVKSDLGESPHSQEPKEALKEATLVNSRCSPYSW
jgi:hypothetical protein